jgi:hypothetical protein
MEKRLFSLLIVVLLSACAARQSATLFPRGADRTQGYGELDRITNTLTVQIQGNEYRGPMIMETSTTMAGLWGPATSTTHTNKASALLLGTAGQIRCDFAFDMLMTQATGVCVDSKEVVYDLLIKN